ncbi:MAG: hypothetical protein CVT48_03530 [Thermoplasmata archaeon HGW-Thermoplasmata-1]|nr:MAG: hypothetical protein CVT48_03530 [Thermoplasmata archaeon HGW-Thermoplasmata-1]
MMPHLEDAAAVFANLETPLSSEGSPEDGKYCTFRSDPKNVECLVSAGIVCVSFANNHSLDYGPLAFSIKTCGSGAAMSGSFIFESSASKWWFTPFM